MIRSTAITWQLYIIIVNGRGHGISTHCSSCTQVTRQNPSVIRVGVTYVNVHVSRHFKGELAWAIDNHVRLAILFNTLRI